MPESWLKKPMAMARKMGRRYLCWKSGSTFVRSSDSTERITSATSRSGSGSPMRLKIFAGFLDEPAADQPARTLRDTEQGHEEQHGGQRCDAEFPAPLLGAEAERADEVVGEIRDQDAGDDIELEESDQPSAFRGGRDFGDVHRADHRRSADRESADQAEDHEARTSSRRRRSRAP